MSTSPPATAPPEPSPPALWEDFVDIFFAPREVFRRRTDGRALPVLLVLTGFMVGLAFVYQVALGPAIEADLVRAVESRAGSDAQMTPAQIEGVRAVSSVLAPLAALVTVPLGVLVTSLLAWALTRVFGTATRFAVVTTVVAYAQFPRILEEGTAIAQGALLDPRSIFDVSIGPVRFVDTADAPAVLVATLVRFDLFLLWSLALIGLGLANAVGLSRGRAVAVASILWLLGGLPGIVQAIVT
jgi:hypothetical protein